MVAGSLYGTSLMGLCLNGKHPRLWLSRQIKPAEKAGRFLIVQGRVRPGTRRVNGTPVLPPAAHLRSSANLPCVRPRPPPIPAAALSA